MQDQTRHVIIDVLVGANLFVSLLFVSGMAYLVWEFIL